MRKARECSSVLFAIGLRAPDCNSGLRPPANRAAGASAAQRSRRDRAAPMMECVSAADRSGALVQRAAQPVLARQCDLKIDLKIDPRVAFERELARGVRTLSIFRPFPVGRRGDSGIANARVTSDHRGWQSNFKRSFIANGTFLLPVPSKARKHMEVKTYFFFLRAGTTLPGDACNLQTFNWPRLVRGFFYAQKRATSAQNDPEILILAGKTNQYCL